MSLSEAISEADELALKPGEPPARKKRKVLPDPTIPPALEKIQRVPFVSVDTFFREIFQNSQIVQSVDLQQPPQPLEQTLMDWKKPNTPLERAKISLLNIDTVTKLMNRNIRSNYDVATRKIAQEGNKGEIVLQQERCKQIGLWENERNAEQLEDISVDDGLPPQPPAYEVADTDADAIIASITAPRQPGVKYTHEFKDFGIFDAKPGGRTRPSSINHYTARVNDTILANIMEGASNSSGFLYNHRPKLRAPYEQLLKKEKTKEEVERTVRVQRETSKQIRTNAEEPWSKI